MTGDPVVKVKNDTQRLKDELKILAEKNKPMHDLVYDLAEFVKSAFNKEIVITMIGRTKEEQDELYKDDARHKVKPRVSPHQLWHGVDIRSTTFTSEEIKKIEGYLNGLYNKTNVYSYTAQCHKVGAGVMHFHLQYAKK
jgi:hypothetical protein